MEERQITSEILVIGGGIIGLSIARELHKKGVRVTVIDQSACGREASWAAAGMLGPDVEAEEGLFFDLCSQSRDLYPEFAAELADETGIDVEIDRTGTLFVAFDHEDGGRLLERCRRQSAANVSAEILSPEQVVSLEPAISTAVKIGAFYKDDWQVENRKLLTALFTYARKHDVKILEDTRVESLVVANGRVTGAETDRGRISAARTVLATGAWTSLIKIGALEMPFRVTPIRGQIVAFKTSKPVLRHVIESEQGYLVPRLDGRLLAGSTSEDVGFDRSTTDAGVSELMAMAGRLVPELATAPIMNKWAGLRPFAADGMPVLGEIESVEGLFIATAHYRSGILLAPVTAKLAAERLIEGGASRYFDLFSPGRFQAQAAGGN